MTGSAGSSTIGVLSSAVLERTLTAYYRGEGHGGADAVGPSALDACLVPTSRRAFQDADLLPSDAEVLGVLEADELDLLGEGYHVITLADPFRRFVLKYVKSDQGVAPLAPADPRPGCGDWDRDHGILEDGFLHPAIWQHIRAFESYGGLALPSRVYLSGDGYRRLNTAEHHALARFRSMGIVRSMGRRSAFTRVAYPGDFAEAKRPDGDVVMISAVIAQPFVTTLADAMYGELQRGNVGRVSDLLDRYVGFVRELWLHGVSHLDFSILNVGLSCYHGEESLVLFDPHMGVIELSPTGPEIHDPLAARPEEQRSLAQLLRAARDGSRWALWRIQETAASAPDVSDDHVAGAAEIVKRFHLETDQIDQGHGLFSHARFGQTWHRRPITGTNDLARAHTRQLLSHPLGEMVQCLVEQRFTGRVYQRQVPVVAMGSDSVLPQFMAGLTVYQRRPLLLVANAWGGGKGLAEHWGRVLMPGELDIQDDPGIRYHLRDLLTGESYVRSGETLVHQGLVVGLAPGRLHALQVQDIVVDDLILDRALGSDLDFSGSLKRCTRRFGVVGDIHGRLEALQEVLRAIGFVDSSGQWFAGNGTLVLTGDVGHGANLQEVFDYLQRLSRQAHARGGRIVWTLGNHDLFADRDGGQGGEDSLGYRLWPVIRDAVLHPSSHPGLLVTAAYFAHGKIFVHGGVLPHIAELPSGQPGHTGARQVVRYINDAFRAALRNRERIRIVDLPHAIFQVGTSHIADPKYPGQEGYTPAGIFTADLRELDHYRFHSRIFPQVVGHTASRNGQIRYSPGSWTRREFIAIDVGRHTGTGNGGLLLTDFGWVAVTPEGPARLVEASSLLVSLARRAAGEQCQQGTGELVGEQMRHAVTEYARTSSTARRTAALRSGRLLLGLPPGQLLALDDFLRSVERAGQCVVMTDLDDTLTAFFGSDLDDLAVCAVADYLDAGGLLAFNTGAPFDWFYARLLRPLIAELVARHGCAGRLAQVLLILDGGNQISAFDQGGYRLLWKGEGRDKGDGIDELIRLSHASDLIPHLDPGQMVYLGDSFSAGGGDRAVVGKVGLVINVGPHAPGMPGTFVNLGGGFMRTLDVLMTAAVALHGPGHVSTAAAGQQADDATVWTFNHKHFPVQGRVRIRVGASGYVHAGVAQPRGRWAPVYDVPLIPTPEDAFEAVLPPDVDAFTFFWTEPPRTPGHPGHWEREERGGRIFRRTGPTGGPGGTPADRQT
jgi:Calcineurin-like phosphoesterase